MDFRSRNPHLSVWPRDLLDERTTPFPYKDLLRGSFVSIVAIDRSTSFLFMFGRLSQTESEWYGYALEAPPFDETRRRFENGEISWTEFMFNRGWLIEFTIQFGSDEDARVRYISPEDMTPYIHEELAKLDQQGSPYKIHHDRLFQNWQNAKKWGRGQDEAEEEYLEFLDKCNGRFTFEKQAA